jgi:hypothetical protein
MTQPKPMHHEEISSDPDNLPPRSRLFIVVPKQAEAQQIAVSAAWGSNCGLGASHTLLSIVHARGACGVHRVSVRGAGWGGTQACRPRCADCTPGAPVLCSDQLTRPGLQDDAAKHADLEYCKTDLIATKGVVFCKFSKSSSALKALEEITSQGTVGLQGAWGRRRGAWGGGWSKVAGWPPRGVLSWAMSKQGLISRRHPPPLVQLAGYKVKCMLAEPKTKRGRADGSPHQDAHLFGSMAQVRGVHVHREMRALPRPPRANSTAQRSRPRAHCPSPRPSRAGLGEARLR